MWLTLVNSFRSKLKDYYYSIINSTLKEERGRNLTKLFNLIKLKITLQYLLLKIYCKEL